jgi:hypothetical protein
VEVKEILAELDREISRLQQVRALLAGGTVRKTRGPNNKSAVVSAVAASAPKKRNLTPEGRKRIAEAMKRRWAERKKLASAKPSK